MGGINLNKEPSQQHLWGGRLVHLHNGPAGPVKKAVNVDSNVVTDTGSLLVIVILSDLQGFSSGNLRDWAV